ncbi:MAG: amidohydrolase family protein [Bacteroidetes bacterium]|nr:amidohydrolase family protein [Bacteroidota bacterium]
MNFIKIYVNILDADFGYVFLKGGNFVMGTGLDILIKNTNIVNGLGEADFIGDVGINNKKIVSIGSINTQAKVEIDGTGLITCPGFIDTHCHVDLNILDNSGVDNFIIQGVTSLVGGHCGISTSPVIDQDFFNSYMSSMDVKLHRDWYTFEEWLKAVEIRGTAVNYVPLVGHNTLRGAVLGKDFKRTSQAQEVENIKEELEKALDAGAFGMSAGFDGGMVGQYADKYEIMELLKVLKKRNVLFAPHTRHHQNQWASDNKNESAYGLFIGPKGEIITGRYHGLLEILEYAKQIPGIRVMISHLTPIYIIPQPHPDYMDEAIVRATLEEIIEKPRAEGVDISFNMLSSEYSIGSELPMIKSFFNKSLALPKWLDTINEPKFVKALQSKKFREQVKDYVNSGKFKFGMISPGTDPYWSECFRIIKCSNKRYVGKTIFELARERSPHDIVNAIYNEAVEVVCDILMESPRTTWALIKDKREAGTFTEFFKHPYGMPCSDAVAFPIDPYEKGDILNIDVPPTAYNMIPNYLIKMVKKKKYLSINEAVRKITSLPADILRIKDRGVLKEGNWADITILDLNRLKVYNDFENPNLKPEGIQCVIVNGSIAYKNGCLSDLRNGRVLRKNNQ